MNHPFESTPPRRAFLRVAGGGVILAATGVALGGCSADVPAQAVAAWTAASAETDPRRWALAHAILAPHSHNLQSWLVDLSRTDEIVLRCDLSRLLPETDPYARQIMMSHGTFLELLDLAARERGLRSEIQLFPEGAFATERIDGRPVARVRLRPDPGVARDPLFAQIAARRTNRSAYAPERVVSAAAWAAMAAAVPAGSDLSFGFVGPQQPDVLAQHRRIATDAWRIELTTPRTLLESQRLMRVGAAEVARHRDGLSILDPKIVLLERVGLFDRTVALAPDSRALRGQIDDFNAKLAGTPHFLWLVSEGNQRATQVAAGRAYARVQLAATAHGVAMQPLSQALQEYPEQAGPYAAIHRLLDAPAPSHTVQMWARVGHAPPVPPAPRRGLDAHLQPPAPAPRAP